ncbi:MAG: hypothetical protein FWH51_03540 [Dehalococcoidia bacterium]|nr:hypothetical protein [Dehalococcoidia bacterium]
MNKGAILVLFMATLLVIGAFGGLACSRSALQFDVDPISMTGNIRWAEEWVYLDVTITNNTNKGILWIRTMEADSRLSEGDTSFRFSSSGSENFGKASPSWFDKLKKPPIAANNSQTFSVRIGSSGYLDSDLETVLYFTAYQYTLTVEWIEFVGYGRMSSFDNPLKFTFEGYRQ